MSYRWSASLNSCHQEFDAATPCSWRLTNCSRKFVREYKPRLNAAGSEPRHRWILDEYPKTLLELKRLDNFVIGHQAVDRSSVSESGSTSWGPQYTDGPVLAVVIDVCVRWRPMYGTPALSYVGSHIRTDPLQQALCG